MVNTEKIKKLKRTSEVSTCFFPCCQYTFPDNRTITFAISFDDKEYSEGAAVNTEKFGDVVVVYPCFFKAKGETMIFILLHEIGHIRLKHTDPSNTKLDIFGKISIDNYRARKMRKGRAMYTEINADLYAVLNGGSMYEIIGLADHKDFDAKWEYRFTTAELSSRYVEVFRKYLKLSKGNLPHVLESKFEILDDVIERTIFENNNLYFLSESEKCELSEILYEYVINTKIKNDEKSQNLVKKYNFQIGSINEKLNNYCENGILSKELLGVRAEDLLILESNTLVPTVVKGMLFSLENTYEELYENNIKNFENYYENVNSYKDGKELILEKSREILKKLKLKKESCDDERLDHYIYLFESLTKSERAKIPDNKFGIPETKSYPLDTKKHVRSAVILFGKSDKKYRKELAERIFQAMEEFEIPIDIIGPKSTLYQYIPEEKRL